MASINAVGGADPKAAVTARKKAPPAEGVEGSDKARANPAAKVSISSKGQEMQAGGERGVEGAADAPKEERMNELVDFYASRLVKAAKIMEQKEAAKAEVQQKIQGEVPSEEIP